MYSLIFYLSIPIILFVVDLFANKLIKNKKAKNILIFVLSSVILSCICGFRSISVGSDTESYYLFYKECGELEPKILLTRNSHYEKGFIIYNLLFAKLHVPFFMFNIITSIIIIVPVVAFCFRYSKYPMLSLCLYVCFGCFTLNMSGIRQSLSCGICILSLLISGLFKNKFIKILPALLILPAILIHKSSIFFVLIYILSFIKIKKRNSLFIFLIVFLAYILLMPSIVSFGYYYFTDLYSAYSFDPPSGIVSFSGTTLLYASFLVILVLFESFSYPFNDNSVLNKVFFKHPIPYLFTTQIEHNVASIYGFPFALFLFQVIFNLADVYLKLASRLALYGGIGFCVIFPNFLYKVFKGDNRNNLIWQSLLVIFACLYFFFTTLRMNYLNLMPYGVF